MSCRLVHLTLFHLLLSPRCGHHDAVQVPALLLRVVKTGQNSAQWMAKGQKSLVLAVAHFGDGDATLPALKAPILCWC